MSNQDQDKREILSNEEEENSTIFLTPSHEDEKVKKSGMLKKVIACVLTLALIVGAAFAIKLAIPEKEESEDGVDEISLTVGKSKDFPEVQYINGDTTIIFKALEGDEYDSINARDWYIEGIDTDKIDYTKTNAAINTLGGLKAAKQISETVDDALYGFDNPEYVINFIAPEDATVPSYTIKIGAMSPDNAGRYATASNRKGVYLVRAKHFDSFEMDVLDFAEVTKMGQMVEDEGVSNTYYNNGNLIQCDKMDFYTKKIGKTYTFELAKESDLYNYDFTSPEKRPCDDLSVKNLVDLFANGITGDGAYSYKATKEELRNLGLNNPDFSATIYVGGKKRNIKAALQKDGNYAVVVDGEGIIGKVAPDVLALIDMDITEFYNELMLFKSISTIKTMSVEAAGKKYDFSLTTKYDSESQTDKVEKVFLGDRELDLKGFQNYYLELISLTAVEHNYVDTQGKAADMRIYITFNNDEKNLEMKFYKVSDSRYQVEIDSTAVGLISVTSYKNLLERTTKIVAE